MRLAQLSLRRPRALLRPAAGSRLVVVGNGMVGHRLCRELVARGLAARLEVTVIGDESHVAYDRIRLSETPTPALDAIVLSPRGWYEEQGIELITGARVERVDRSAREVELASGQRLPYDLLVFATGSAPFLPSIDGVDGPGVLVFRGYDDLTELLRRARPDGHAAVIGGGLLGLETAKVLLDRGMRVHLVESSSHLMPRQLDALSAEVLDHQVRALGVETHLGVQTRAIEQLERGARLRFEGDRPALEVDFVVVAAGVRPCDELARDCGLQVAARGGVMIDDNARTSDHSVLAIGECVSHRGERIGLVGPGYAMAAVVADNLDGGRSRLTGADASCHLKLLGVPVSAAGLYDREATLLGVDVGEGRRRTLMLDGRRLIGVTSVGPWPGLARAQDAAMRQVNLSERQLRRFRKDGELWPLTESASLDSWPASTVVCNCAGVTLEQLRARTASGMRDVPSLREATGAAATCGSCIPLLARLVDAPVAPSPAAGRATLLVASLAALASAVAFAALEPIPFAESVQQTAHRLDQLWRDNQLKQWSGFGLVALATLGGVLSLRKRVGSFRLGPYGAYRAIHAVTGALCVTGLVAHTGLRFGNNLNLLLMCVFSGVCATGALSGVVTALESATESPLGRRARAARRPLTWIHLLLFWPLPMLIGLHVFSVYYF